MKYKHARGINSRSDEFKCFSGPFFKLIESIVYAHPAFIKHVPVRERPKYIVDMLGGFPGPFLETDYSQFEKHFTPDVMEVIEMELYSYMLAEFPYALGVIKSAMMGTNHCNFKKFRIDIDGRRMSGEMCTSLGNGFSNLMLADFIATDKGGVITGVVEGDDGLFFSSVPITSADFLELGFEIKMLVHNNLLHSSFCGLVMSKDLCTMTDPRKVLMNIGWTHSPLMFGGHKVRMGLLRAKALSLAYEHPRCPILSCLALRLLTYTSGFRPRFESNVYEASLTEELERFKDETRELLTQGPSLACRAEFAELFEISVERQYEIEFEIQSWNGGPLTGQSILSLFHEGYNDCRDYYERFTSAVRGGSFLE
jgi:hypothetical protein